MKLSIAITKIELALKSCDNVTLNELTDKEFIADLRTAKAKEQAAMSIELLGMPKDFLRTLLQTVDLTSSQKEKVLIVLEGDKVIEWIRKPLGSTREMHDVLEVIAAKNTAQFEIRLGSRWYPVIVKSYHGKTYGSDSYYLSIQATLNFVDDTPLEAFRDYIFDDYFEVDGQKVKKTIEEVLSKEVGVRLLTQDLSEYQKLVEQATVTSMETGKVFNATGVAVIQHEFAWWKSQEVIEFGNQVSKQKIVIEADLETKENRSSYRYNRDDSGKTVAPFVRVFSLEQKRYVHVDIRDLEEYKWDEKAIERLILPDKLNKMLHLVFETNIERLFGDIISGKHGGMIIMATGTTGVGKTLSAEIFSELSKRPLYVMEVAELGTNLNDIESNLQRVFIRSRRWNAVLLFDEADVFMTTRNDDLQRSAIVGIFLRLMDYYRGMLFMTTNRPEVIDPAFKSRITLQLDYPKLERETRKKIWEIMLKAAGLKVNHGSNIDNVADLDLNGRQIRNLVRLLKVVHPEGELTEDHVLEITNFAVK